MSFQDIEHTPSEHEGHHVIPASVYYKAAVALMFLLIVTVAVSMFDAPRWLGVAIAMSIALVKASIVVAYFMGVKFQSKLTWLWASVGFVWLIVLFLTIFDYTTRDWITVYGW